MKIHARTALASAVLCLSQAYALPPEPIVRYKLTGSVTLTNCNAALSDVHVRLVQPAKSASMKSRTVLADGSVRMAYEMAFEEPLSGNFSVRPSIRSGVCTGGAFTPASRSLTRIPATNVNFSYLVTPSEVRRVPARDFASQLNLALNSIQMKLNNKGGQTSFLALGAQRITFDIPVIRKDIDCGTVCPDFGDALFYVQDMNLQSADLDYIGPYFRLEMAFEDGGREVKGYHNRLGDDFVPDFDLGRPKLSLSAQPVLTSAGGMSLHFFTPHLDASINATGGCSVAGVDLCNAIFGTDRIVQKGMETAALNALNGGTIQAAVSLALGQYLQFLGIQGRLVNVRLDGGDVVLSIR